MFFKQFFGVEFPTDLKTGLHQTGRSNHHPLIYFLKVYFMVYRNKLSQYVQLRVFVQDPCPFSDGIAQVSIIFRVVNDLIHAFREVLYNTNPAANHVHDD